MSAKGHPSLVTELSAKSPYWRAVRKGVAPAFNPHNLRQVCVRARARTHARVCAHARVRVHVYIACQALCVQQCSSMPERERIPEMHCVAC